MKNANETEMCWFGNEKYLFGKASEQVKQKNKVIESEIISFIAYNLATTKVFSCVCGIKIFLN
jgi:hypothetical protein